MIIIIIMVVFFVNGILKVIFVYAVVCCVTSPLLPSQPPFLSFFLTYFLHLSPFFFILNFSSICYFSIYFLSLCLSACSFNVDGDGSPSLDKEHPIIFLLFLLPPYFPCCFLSFIFLPPTIISTSFIFKSLSFQHVFVPTDWFALLMHL